MNRIFSLLGLIATTGCSSVVIPTVAKLSGLSPLDADPSGFEVAIDLPEGASVDTGDATFIIESRHSGLDHHLREVFALERQEVDSDRLMFRFAQADLARVLAIQSQAAAWKAADPKLASGSISVRATPCIIGDGPDLGDTLSISLRIKPNGPLLPLVRNAKISELLDAADVAAEDRGTSQVKQCTDP